MLSVVIYAHELGQHVERNLFTDIYVYAREFAADVERNLVCVYAPSFVCNTKRELCIRNIGLKICKFYNI